MKPDVLIVNPNHIDFPMFRYQIRQLRHLFENVIVVFSNHQVPYPNLYQSLMPLMQNDHILCLPAVATGGKDWRHVAVTRGLAHCNANSILFLEQDFIVKNGQMLPEIFDSRESVVGFHDDRADRVGCKILPKTRLHPAFLLIRTAILQSTSQDFAAHGPRSDHFGQIFHDLVAKGQKYNTLLDMGYHQPNDWEHLQGLTQNYTLLMSGNPVTFQKDRFVAYNQQILQLDIEHPPHFRPWIEKAATL